MSKSSRDPSWQQNKGKEGTKILDQAHTGQRPDAFVLNVGMCVSAPRAINYIHMILHQYNQLNKFVVFRNVTSFLCMGVAFVMKHVVTETKVIRLC